MREHFFFRRPPSHWIFVLLTVLALFGFASAGCGKHDPAGMQRWARDGQRILFVYSGTAERVCIVGSFNGWEHDQDCLTFRNGRWELEMVVPSGRHGYGFFVDREVFHADPQALLREDDGFGRVNSVLIVD